MDSLRKFLTGGSVGSNDGYDEDSMNGATVSLSPGQVKEDVHYMESRGSIDLSYLRFHSDDRSGNFHSLSNYRTDSNNTSAGENESEINKNTRSSSIEWKESFLDIAIFKVPEHCTSRNCDLSKFGVGALAHFDGNSYLSLCQGGRLRLDHNTFKGHHTQLMIPSEGAMPDRIKRSRSNKFSMPKNRHYEVMLANCNEKGRHLHVMGQVVFDLIDSDAVVNNLTAGSLTILMSLAFTVFAFLTILAIRINLGTRADFEHSQYAIISGGDEAEQENSTSDSDTSNGDEVEQTDDNETS